MPHFVPKHCRDRPAGTDKPEFEGSDRRFVPKRPKERPFMNAKTNRFLSLLPGAMASFAFAGMTLSAPQAHAQQAAPSPSWAKICSKIGENDICNVQYTIVTGTGQLVTAVNLLQASGQTKRRIFQIAVPSGRYIPQGVTVKIDNGKANTLPYSICLPDRCLAEVQLSAGLVKALKGGGNIVVTSTNFRSQKNPVNVSLKGFTASYDGPPLKENEVQGRNKKLQEELKKKADETRQKLKDAQDKAKTGG